MLQRVRWRRALIAALLSEVAVIVVLVSAITIYSRLFMPGITDAEYQALGQRFGYYIAPAAATVITFLMALWVGRRLPADHVVNGVMVGAIGVILTSAFFFTARSEDQLMYLVSFALRIVAGYLGGIAAEKRHYRQLGAVSA